MSSVRVSPSERPLATARQLVSTVSVPRLSLVIECEAGQQASREIVIDGDTCRIGAHSSNDVVVQDPAVSRFHCRLVLEEGVWRVRDWSSLNGTRLDGIRIRDVDLPVDASIAMGDSVVRVRPVAPVAEAVVPVVPAFGLIAGTSLPMRKLFGVLDKIAPTDLNVLIEGESGTGKELVAHEVVQRSPRSGAPFVVVDCGAISPNLVESELFGHVRGAFTGADRDRTGAFEAANGGTVFLDEVGELPLELQPKLLRVIEARQIRRVGETNARPVNVRIVSATNRDLDREVNRGRFREDLYFRLAVMAVRVPPLRERLDDLLLLVRVFLRALGQPEDEHLFSSDVLAAMARHDWPGNVRELRNYVERTVALQQAAPTLSRSTLRPPPPPASSPPSAGGSGPWPAQSQPPPAGEPWTTYRVAKDEAMRTFERGYLAALLEAAGHNMSRAARMANVDRMYLHRLVQKHGLRGGGGSAEVAPPLGEPSPSR
ncbi:MAG: sigma 54-interacting transcriptional regulator [Polyangiaceae bacterium]